MPFGADPMNSQAVASLGMRPGTALNQQQQDQSEELRKKKQREQQLMGLNPSVASIFGPLGGGGLGTGM